MLPSDIRTGPKTKSKETHLKDVGGDLKLLQCSIHQHPKTPNKDWLFVHKTQLCDYLKFVVATRVAKP